MNRSIRVIAPPTVEPVSLTEAKMQCRVDVTDDDALIAGLIVAARQEVERRTWHALMYQTLEYVLDAWPSRPFFDLPRPPLVSVTSIKYITADGTEQTFDSANYIVSTAHVPGRVVLANGARWPNNALYPVGAIRARYVAGWASAADVPQALKQAILLLVAHWYEAREAVIVTGAVPKEIPFGVSALLQDYRMRTR